MKIRTERPGIDEPAKTYRIRKDSKVTIKPFNTNQNVLRGQMLTNRQRSDSNSNHSINNSLNNITVNSSKDNTMHNKKGLYLYFNKGGPTSCRFLKWQQLLYLYKRRNSRLSNHH